MSVLASTLIYPQLTHRRDCGWVFLRRGRLQKAFINIYTNTICPFLLPYVCECVGAGCVRRCLCIRVCVCVRVEVGQTTIHIAPCALDSAHLFLLFKNYMWRSGDNFKKLVLIFWGPGIQLRFPGFEIEPLPTDPPRWREGTVSVA